GLDRVDAQPGDVRRVGDHKGHPLSVADYSSSSQITLRFLSSRMEAIDADFLRRRIDAAYEYRQRVVSGSDAYRLIHAEGDLLPGLIVDHYADWLVAQFLDQGMDRLTEEIVVILQTQLSPKGILARNDAAVRSNEGLPLEKRVLAGDVPERIGIQINGLTC